MSTEQTTHEIDVFIGRRIKQLRRQKNISQQALANAVGVSFQQIQKYESAANRISASKLTLIADFFEVEFGFFIEGFAKNEKRRPVSFENMLSDRDGLVVATTFMTLPHGLRHHFSGLIAELSAA